MSDHAEPEGGRRRLVCMGLRLDTRSRLASFIDEEGNRYGWRKPVLGPAVAGSQYDVAFDAEGAPILSFQGVLPGKSPFTCNDGCCVHAHHIAIGARKAGASCR